jgi:hypothetical protein
VRLEGGKEPLADRSPPRPADLPLKGIHTRPLLVLQPEFATSVLYQVLLDPQNCDRRSSCTLGATARLRASMLGDTWATV